MRAPEKTDLLPPAPLPAPAPPVAPLAPEPPAAPPAPEAKRSPASRIRTVEGLRGLAALLVVFDHTVGKDWGLGAWSRQNHGITVFALLTGFLLSSRFLRARLDGRPAPWSSPEIGDSRHVSYRWVGGSGRCSWPRSA